MRAAIQITCEYLSPVELQSELVRYNESDKNAFELRLDKMPSRWRGLDQNVLLALVGLTSGSIGALITGLLKIAEKRQDAFIELHGDKWSLKVLSGTPYKEIEKLVDLAKLKTIEEIKIIKGS